MLIGRGWSSSSVSRRLFVKVDLNISWNITRRSIHGKLICSWMEGKSAVGKALAS
jgi:hypothetical protein